MANYIDGFVFPIPGDRLEEYQRVAGEVAAIWKEHGALDYLEFVGDDMHREGTRSFVDMSGASDNESIVFGWITYESRESRDLVNEKIEADPRMIELVGPLMDPANPIFDSLRMAYAGFKPLVH